jgi:transcriptional regulator with XRE-family HTH domain
VSDFGMMSDMSMFTRTDGGQIPQWSFSDRLRKAREHAGMEQADLAALLGKKRSTISNWERGANRPDELALRAIAYHTGVPFTWLVTGDDPDPGAASTIWYGDVIGEGLPLLLAA